MWQHLDKPNLAKLAQRHPRARKRRAPAFVVFLHFSGGCLNVALKARSEFRRIAVGRRASLVTFLSRTRKLLARRCDEPASVIQGITELGYW